MAAARRCDMCQEPYIAKNSRSRFCSSVCRARASQTGLAKAVEAPDASGSGLVESVRHELDSVGRLESMLGQSAIVLATRIASATDSGAGIAALSKELRSVMAEAVAGATQALSRTDEMKARRDAKRDRASTG